MRDIIHFNKLYLELNLSPFLCLLWYQSTLDPKMSVSCFDLFLIRFLTVIIVVHRFVSTVILQSIFFLFSLTCFELDFVIFSSKSEFFRSLFDLIVFDLRSSSIIDTISFFLCSISTRYGIDEYSSIDEQSL